MSGASRPTRPPVVCIGKLITMIFGAVPCAQAVRRALANRGFSHSPARLPLGEVL